MPRLSVYVVTVKAGSGAAGWFHINASSKPDAKRQMEKLGWTVVKVEFDGKRGI